VSVCVSPPSLLGNSLVDKQQLCEHIPAVDAHATIEELLDT
jgi:hypothetical protein